jgi:NTP pyrophosphatase (non-canonical NTP hydrolase)
MSEATDMVSEFHETFDVAIAAPDTTELRRLRQSLISEEAREASEVLLSWDGSLECLAKELADLVYVAYGTAVSFGIDLDEALRRVHASNMSKVDEDGLVTRRPDGKILKPANYQPPDMRGVVL